MNFFKLYIGDYQRDTGTLTLAEHGAYLLMLQYYYATETPLPTGRELHRLLRAESKQERDAIDRVASQFWELTETGWVNDRAWEEIEKGQKQRTTNQELGKRGGRPKKTESDTKKETESKTESVSKPKPNNNPNQTPDTIARSNSDTNVSGSELPIDQIWGLGVELFSQAKIKEKQARTLIGKLCKDYGQEVAREALLTAIKARPANPYPYMEAVCKNKNRKPPIGKQAAIEERNARVLQEILDAGVPNG